MSQTSVSASTAIAQPVIVSVSNDDDVANYISQMNELQRKAYLIAKNHLGTSFNIVKSNGYKEWQKGQKK
jgi:hypothetical protein